MPGEIENRMRLLQAVSYPGHGVLMQASRTVLVSADPAMAKILEAIGASPSIDEASTLACGGDYVACVVRDETHTLVVAVPSAIDTMTIHAKMKQALALYSRREEAAWSPPGSSGEGGSGAPAELFVGRPRPRPS